ncbi:hypothetical protein GDO81_024686 [Engystomops pustulosus]|uniref:Uncharacterized protein n=1 Tax=Engystomops pustulosus TaxID=76066 RepID=A0AAV6YQ97_ENGPU|nr:hypothetical protein GDO81_024686 [Engystomops pustulosus]
MFPPLSAGFTTTPSSSLNFLIANVSFFVRFEPSCLYIRDSTSFITCLRKRSIALPCWIVGLNLDFIPPLNGSTSSNALFSSSLAKNNIHSLSISVSSPVTKNPKGPISNGISASFLSF